MDAKRDTIAEDSGQDPSVEHLAGLLPALQCLDGLLERAVKAAEVSKWLSGVKNLVI